MSDPITLTSGAKFQITPSSFELANALRKSLMRTVKGIPLGDNPLNQDLSVLKDVFLEAASSDDVERCLFACLERASYQDVKVTKNLFDDPKLGQQARSDLFEIFWKCIEVNLGPFFVKIFSVLSERLKTPGATLKSPSQQTTA